MVTSGQTGDPCDYISTRWSARVVAVLVVNYEAIPATKATSRLDVDAEIRVTR